MSSRQLSQAKQTQASLIYRLHSSDLPGANELARLLEGCKATKPCRSAACPICGLAFQAAAVEVVNRFVVEPARSLRSRKQAVTVVPASGCVEPDELIVETFLAVAEEVRTALAAADVPPMIVGIEASLNEDRTRPVDPHWQVHGHGVGFDWWSKEQRKEFRAAFPPFSLAKRPVLFEPLDDNPRGRRYPFKPERPRRVTQWSKPSAERNPHRETKPRPLRRHQACRLALVEHQLGFRRRLVLHGVDDEAVGRHLEGLGWPRDGP